MRIFRCSSSFSRDIIAFVCCRYADGFITKGDRIPMPLIITLALFGALFALEGCEAIAKKFYGERALRRYEHVEHPRAGRNDRYVDYLG